VVVDPFSDNCVVITGSHNLGYTASYNNDENMAIIRSHRAIAEAYAAHCLDVYDHYAWRYWLNHDKDKAWHFLAADDAWQDSYFSADNQVKSAELGFWLGAIPAADSLPALLVYDAELILVSVRGERKLPYVSFHTGYKQTLLAPDELIQTVCLQRRYSRYFSHARKVGARNAQAISKVCIAGLGRMANGVVEDIRVALGSVAPVPLRLTKTEQVVKGQTVDAALMTLAKKTTMAEIRPIDDIRSTARYRSEVAGNLVVEFLNRLNSQPAERALDYG